MKNRRNTLAVSEILGEVILLAIAVTSIAVIYIQVLSTPGPTDITNVAIIGKIEEGHPVFDLQRGESLGPDTKTFITLAGYERWEFFQKDLGNQEWDIGERIVLPVGDVRGVQVETTIVDTKTNAIVFWAQLQEGLVTFFKGGIWHFDEPWWNGTYNEVRDSSGNQNHGIALAGAEIISGSQEPENVKRNNSGNFDGFMNLVKVKTSWTLNITKNITIEAWMNPQVPQFIADIIGVSGAFGYYPYVIPVVDNIYALVSEDAQQDCKLSTVEINEEGFVTECQNLTAGSSTAHNLLQPKIVHINEGLVIISYIDDKKYMHLKTFNISQNGSIEYTGYQLIFNDYVSSQTKPNFPSLQKITNNCVAIAYWAPSIGGILKTVEITSNGYLACIDTKTFEPWYDPCLIHSNGQVYAVAYRDSLNRGFIKTFIITPDGNITYTGKTVEFENGSAYEPSLIQISGNVFAVAYRNSDKFGVVKTFNIYSNGSIVLTGKMKVFENENKFPCYNPYFISGQEDTYVIAYATAAPGADVAKGYVMTLNIGQDGSINSNGQRKLFDGDAASYPTIIHIADQLYAISYTGHSKHPGMLITMLIGPHGRGIYKGNSYELYANMTFVEGYINSVYVSYYNTSLGEHWHHFALTYDGMNIRLYDNGLQVAETAYTQTINPTEKPLYFGRFYCGYIDEIAIYDKALTQEQILNHYNNPGIFDIISILAGS